LRILSARCGQQPRLQIPREPHPWLYPLTRQAQRITKLALLLALQTRFYLVHPPFIL
jgi:hypothetical protein